MLRLLSIALLIGMTGGPGPALAQTPPAAHPARPIPPTRDPNTPGYVAAKELADGTNAPADGDGNFILGPTHNRAPETLQVSNGPGVKCAMISEVQGTLLS